MPEIPLSRHFARQKPIREFISSKSPSASAFGEDLEILSLEPKKQVSPLSPFRV
jgi:hypothetical protein